MSDVGEVSATHAAQKLVTGDLPPGDWFALRVKGDSMDRVAPDGSVVLVNHADRRLVPGAFYIFGDYGEATFKRFLDKPVRLLAPYSTNPSHDPIAPKPGFVVIGRVRRVVTDL